MNGFRVNGWTVFDPEPLMRDWATHALQDARRALEDPALAHSYECDGTWFVGLDALNNDTEGRVGGSGPLAGTAVDFVTRHCGGWPKLHRAQVSGVFPGYPRPRSGETEAAFRYRLNRDAAHVDGVIGKGVPKRRFIEEPHAFILGVPLTTAGEGASPLVVWDGSHRIIQDALRTAVEAAGEADWSKVDVTDAYQAVRKQVFDTCRRRPIVAEPGAVILLHRLALHGVAPWKAGAEADQEGRLIAYFRPPMVEGVRAWLGEVTE